MDDPDQCRLPPADHAEALSRAFHDGYAAGRASVRRGITDPCPGSGLKPKGWPHRELMGKHYPSRGTCSVCGRDYKMVGRTHDLAIYKHRRWL